MTSKIIRAGARQAAPIMSVDKADAKRRVINLYRAWYRQIPSIVHYFDTPLTKKDVHNKLRESFEKNKKVTDIRVIDILVLKGHMELMETVNMWKQSSHLMRYFKESWNPKPTDFMSKFLSGKE